MSRRRSFRTPDLGQGVGDQDLTDGQAREALESPGGKDAVRRGDTDPRGALFPNEFYRFGERSAGIDHVIDDEDIFPPNVPMEALRIGDVRPGADLVDQGDLRPGPQKCRKPPRPRDGSRIGGNDNLGRPFRQRRGE